MKTSIQSWKRTVGQKIRRLTPEGARAAIAEIEAERKAACPLGGATIFHPTIRALTGGFNSQSINFYVIRKLADKARGTK